MNATIEDTLLALFQQVIENPDCIPVMLTGDWPEGTEQQRLLTSFRDMLERLQQHQQDRLDTQGRFWLAVQGANDGLWDRHIPSNEYHLSTRWKSMLGYEEHEITDSVEEWLKRIHPDDRDRALAAGRAYINGETDTYEIEYRLRHRDGTYRWILARGAALRDANGKAYRLAGSNTDITERKLAEQQLREREEQHRQILEQRVEERTRELATLLEVSRKVASTIELNPLLDLILDQLKVVVDYTASSITILEDDYLILVGAHEPGSEEPLMQRRFSLKHLEPIWELLCRGEPVIIDDVWNDFPLAEAYRKAVGELLETTFRYSRSWVAIPLKLKDQVIGMLSVSHSQPHYYTSHHADLALAIASQAAIAIENARLYTQAQELAALEERQKLARELHDSVSQALYGIALGLHTARIQLERDPDELPASIDDLLSLAEAALTEMRALIFELRPESLEREGLVSALTRQAAVLQARHEIVVSTELCDEPDLLLHSKQELYRIALEAMHNTVKHARANKVVLRLKQTADGLAMEVQDDGMGFDASDSFPGHLGLHSMRERVASLGGTFQVESLPGAGTRISVRIPERV